MIGSATRTRSYVGILGLWHSTIGKKWVMAITGFILWGFVILHMLGNLKIYLGAEELNAYGAFLRVMGSPILLDEMALWMLRAVLFVAAILHIVSAVQLTQRDRASRPVGYRMRKDVRASIASRTMLAGGVIVAIFIVVHLFNFTFGLVSKNLALHPDFIPGDIYHNVVTAFQNPLISVFYVVAMLALGLHLWHGVWSAFQTLGLNSRRSERFWRNFASVFAVILVLGNASIPIAVLVGLVK